MLSSDLHKHKHKFPFWINTALLLPFFIELYYLRNQAGKIVKKSIQKEIQNPIRPVTSKEIRKKLIEKQIFKFYSYFILSVINSISGSMYYCPYISYQYLEYISASTYSLSRGMLFIFLYHNISNQNIHFSYF